MEVAGSAAETQPFPNVQTSKHRSVVGGLCLCHALAGHRGTRVGRALPQRVNGPVGEWGLMAKSRDLYYTTPHQRKKSYWAEGGRLKGGRFGGYRWRGHSLETQTPDIHACLCLASFRRFAVLSLSLRPSVRAPIRQQQPVCSDNPTAQSAKGQEEMCH